MAAVAADSYDTICDAFALLGDWECLATGNVVDPINTNRFFLRESLGYIRAAMDNTDRFSALYEWIHATFGVQGSGLIAKFKLLEPEVGDRTRETKDMLSEICDDIQESLDSMDRYDPLQPPAGAPQFNFHRGEDGDVEEYEDRDRDDDDDE